MDQVSENGSSTRDNNVLLKHWSPLSGETLTPECQWMRLVCLARLPIRSTRFLELNQKMVRRVRRASARRWVRTARSRKGHPSVPLPASGRSGVESVNSLHWRSGAAFHGGGARDRRGGPRAIWRKNMSLEWTGVRCAANSCTPRAW